MVAIAVEGALADTPASQVFVQTVQPTQSYPEVPANGEGWFDVGGFCKVVDVGDLSSISPPASGIPVFVPGPTDQWENYRTSAPSDSNYKGKLTLTTCCRPQMGIAELCTEAGATVVQVSRQYGKVGEVDIVSATCVDQWGKTYQDQISVACLGDNGPDGQAEWAKSSPDAPSACTPNTYTSPCSAQCGGGTSTVYDSCGNITAVNKCNTQPCCTDIWEESTCNGSKGIFHNAGTCPTKTKTVASACVFEETHYSSGCESSCDPGSHTSTIFGAGCNQTFQSCGTWHGSTAGGHSCSEGYSEIVSTTVCTNGRVTTRTTKALTSRSCTCSYSWEGWVWR